MRLYKTTTKNNTTYCIISDYKNLEGKRHNFILATKSMSRTYESMKKDIEISLANLKTDYIDLYQLHNVQLKEEYLQDDVVTESDVFYDFIVPEGYFFAMGDNRTKSTDCRAIGCIPYEKLEGIVRFRFWPFSEFGKID